MQNDKQVKDKPTDNCTHDCSSCRESCSSRTETDVTAQLRKDLNKIKKTFAVMSGKGGVGKSFVTTCLSSGISSLGAAVAVLDADITGPSIPKAFGIKKKAMGGALGIEPVSTALGIKVMSLNLLVENESDPVVWRGAMIAGCAGQFYNDVVWGDIDYMFVDMPPGTGDIPLTVLQSFHVDGIILVTSPQELVGMIVEKAAKMAKMMNVPIVALVENMTYFVCPDCSKRHYIFGKSNAGELAKRYNIPLVAELPINSGIASAMDSGNAEGNFELLLDLCKDLMKL